MCKGTLGDNLHLDALSHIELSSRLPYVKALGNAGSEMKMFSFAGFGALLVFWIHTGVNVETDLLYGFFIKRHVVLIFRDINNNFGMRSYDVDLSCRKWSE